MKKTMFTALALAGLAAVSAQAAVEKFHNGEQAVFLGDSITDMGMYIEDLQLYWDLRYPGSNVAMYNRGIGGQCAWHGRDRFAKDIAVMKPDRVFVMYGMNDVGREWWGMEQPNEKEQERRAWHLKSYSEHYPAVLDLIRDCGAKAVVMTPTPYDQYGSYEGKNYPYCNSLGLTACAASNRVWAAERKLPVVEFHQPLTELCKQHPDSHFCGSDRVHPWGDGHVVMMALFLEAMGESGLVAETTLDAQGKNGLEFTYAPKALPYPITGNYLLAERYLPLTEKLNREPLTVKNLAKGWYRLTFDGKIAGVFSSDEFAAGVNLALLDTPNSRIAKMAFYKEIDRRQIRPAISQVKLEWTDEKTGRVKVEPQTAVGPVKPVNGIGQPPLQGVTRKMQLFHYLKEAGIPYSRFHDLGGWVGGGLYADIPNLFRNFDADENDPKNYTFAMTDAVVKELAANGVEPFFRLGVTIENFVQVGFPRINTMPPKDYAKWARICEHVIRHYTEGWADGFRMKLEYWEIWNEPDNNPDRQKDTMWGGTFEDYIEFYGVVAPYLKAKFPHLKIGGYGSCGFYAGVGSPTVKAANSTPRSEFFVICARQFLQAAKEQNWPLDFFSFHSYSDPAEALKQVGFADQVLNEYGFTKDRTERIFNEWLPMPGAYAHDLPARSSKVAAELIGLQQSCVQVACIYDARCGSGDYAALFNPATYQPYKSYYAFKAFHELRKLGNEVWTENGAGIYAVASAKDGEVVVMASNPGRETVPFRVELPGYEFVEARITDGKRNEEFVNLPRTLPGESFAFIRFRKR